MGQARYIKRKLLIISLLISLFGSNCAFGAQLTRKETYESIQSATKYESTGDYFDAIEIYEQLLVDKPLNRQYMNQIGRLYYQASYFKEAKASFQKTLKWYGNDLEAHLYLGKIAFVEEQFSDAIVYLEWAHTKIPEDVEIIALLAKSYFALGDKEKALQLAKKGLEIDPHNNSVRNLVANIALSKGEYALAYGQFKESWNDSHWKNRRDLEGMLITRKFVNPSIEVLGRYSHEKELDLVTKTETTGVNRWDAKAKYRYPVREFLTLTADGGFSPVQEKNELMFLNNFYVNNYFATVGIEYAHSDWINVNVKSRSKWGTNRGDGVIFPFKSGSSWEPEAFLQIRWPTFIYTVKGYKDTFIGRNFSSYESYYVQRRGVFNSFILRLSDVGALVGLDGAINIMGDKNETRFQEVNTFITKSIDISSIKAEFEYRFTYGHFDNVDVDYFSYKRRVRNLGSVKLYHTFSPGCELEGKYTFKWQNLHDFVNVATQINSRTPAPPEILKRNVLTAHQFDVVGKWSMEDWLTFNAGFNYYFDSNSYTTVGIEASLNTFF